LEPRNNNEDHNNDSDDELESDDDNVVKLMAGVTKNATAQERELKKELTKISKEMKIDKEQWKQEKEDLSSKQLRRLLHQELLIRVQTRLREGRHPIRKLGVPKRKVRKTCRMKAAW
jgi:hypothetical protein